MVAIGETAAQRAVIDRAPAVLAADERILAGWLVGSFGTGLADRHSDIDLHCLITEESADWFREHWPETAERLVGPLVLAQSLPVLIGGFTVTPDWLHLDLIMHPQGTVDPTKITGLLPIYDRAGDLLPEQPLIKETFGTPYFPEREVKQFLYFLGNLPVLAGRGELILLHASVSGFRDILIGFMLAERGVRDRGGAKRLNPFLTEEQRRTLETLPTATLDLEEIMNALHVVTRTIRERTRRLAGRTGSPWPDELEQAALRSIDRQLCRDFR